MCINKYQTRKSSSNAKKSVPKKTKKKGREFIFSMNLEIIQ